MFKKLTLVVVIAALALSSLVACQKPAASSTFKIGAIAAQTGNYSGLGMQSLEGMQFVVDQVNQGGGINGVPLELINYDDKSEATEVALVAKKLIEVDKVHILVAGSASNLSVSVIPIANEEKTPSVLLMGTALFNDKLGAWNFNPMGSEATYIILVLDYMRKQGITNYAALIENGSYGQGAKTFLPDLNTQYGTTVVTEQYFDAGASDLTPQLTNIKNSSAQAIFLWGSSPTASMAVKQIKEMGITLPIFATPPQVVPNMIESFGQYYNMAPALIAVTQKIDIWQQLPDSDPDKAKYQEFAGAYQAKYNHPPAMWSVLGAQQILFAVDGLKRAGADPAKVDDARAKIRDAFEKTTNLDLLTAIYTMSPSDHFGNIKERMVLVTFKDGQKTYVP